MTTDEKSTEILREEILADAKKKAEEIVMAAQREAEEILAAAAVERSRLTEDHLCRSRNEASRKAELILATVPVETGRMRAARVETLLDSIREEAEQRLKAREGFGYRETVCLLASRAIERMTGADFVVRVPEGDRALLGDDIGDEIKRRTGKTVSLSVRYEQNSENGVIVEDAEARQVWDNRLGKRLERLWPEVRRHIAVEFSFVPKKESGGDGP